MSLADRTESARSLNEDLANMSERWGPSVNLDEPPPVPKKAERIAALYHASGLAYAIGMDLATEFVRDGNVPPELQRDRTELGILDKAEGLEAILYSFNCACGVAELDLLGNYEIGLVERRAKRLLKIAIDLGKQLSDALARTQPCARA